MSEIPYTVRRSSRARRVRVNVHAHAGVEVVLPARAPERAAAAAVRELRPWIERRLGEAHEALARVAARAGTVPFLDDTLALVSQPGRTRAHRDGGRLLVPDGTRGRRSSATTGARRARRSPRAWTARRRSLGRPTGTCRSAPNAPAGRRARRTAA